jgi:hypothetical protein
VAHQDLGSGRRHPGDSFHPPSLTNNHILWSLRSLIALAVRSLQVPVDPQTKKTTRMGRSIVGPTRT